jgi:hypothetical protein
MTPRHRNIPELPEHPRIHPLSSNISRSYSVGRHNFSRACVGDIISLSISSPEPLRKGVVARLVVKRNGDKWVESRFEPIDTCTLQARLEPTHSGLHCFRAEFSVNNGATWLEDTVPDAWLLVDPAQIEAMRLYTMVPSVSGTIADWTANLDHIQTMGFNAVHLLPITTRDTSESPYSARDLFSIDPGYLVKGSRDDLTQIEGYIDAAAGCGIRLCFDLVLNHVGIDSAMAKRAPAWIVPDETRPDGLQRARYWSGDSWKYWEDLVLINYEHPSDSMRSEIWAYMTEYALFWAKFANDTGGFVRLDNLHGSNPLFMKELTVLLHTEYPDLAILAEYFADEPTILNSVPDWCLNLLLATPWEHKFVPDLRDHLKYLQRISRQIRYYTPVTSHDSGAPAQEFGSANSTVPRYVAAALMGTGATGIVQGVEYGESERIDFIGIRPKITYPPVARFGRFLTRVNGILEENPAFRKADNCFFVDGGHDAIIATFHPDENDDTYGFLVLCNFDIQASQSITIDLSSYLTLDWPLNAIELIRSVPQTFCEAKIDFMLSPSSAKVYKLLRPKLNQPSPPS